MGSRVYSNYLMSFDASRIRKRTQSRYLSVSELAVRWSISPSAIYGRKCGTDKLTPIRLGRSVRFLRAEVEAFEIALESQLRRMKLS
jgi:predicted DNA-binding transcriptional regulator AlpA